MKNIKFVLAALLLGCVAMTSCQKDDIPEGATRLFAEGFQSDDKTSVSGNAVYWEDGDDVTINGSTHNVEVSNGQAYIITNLRNEHSLCGYYSVGDGCSINSSNGSFTGIVFPRSYNSTYLTNGRQVIALPMVTYNANSAEGVKFRHISAAVLVKVKNEMGSTIVIDSVSVTSTNGKKLSGNGVSASFSDGLPDVSPNNVEGNNNYNSTAVIIGNSTTIGDDDILEVQVPILPVSDCNLKVRVYSHNANASVNERYTFEHTVEGITLGRNEMLTAGCRINTTTGRVAIGRTIDLSDLTDDYTAQNGDILTGSLDENVKVSIADGATITLDNAVIEGRGGNLGNNYPYSGLTCNGDATIILADGSSNTIVSGCTFPYTAGIQAAANHTLTIIGNGDLIARGFKGAGIGCSELGNCGHIIINCGSESDISVQSGEGAGIGTGGAGYCGDITIKCGTFTCNGGFIGIGSANTDATCGNITINGGNFTFSGTNMAIGCSMGNQMHRPDLEADWDNTSYCGDINISNATITSTSCDSKMCCIGAGRGDNTIGDLFNNYVQFDTLRGAFCGNITITNSHLTITSGQYGAGIGTGQGGFCRDITINGGSFTFSGGADAAKIGTGRMGRCGNISISNVTLGSSQQNPLQGGNNSAAIGASNYAICGNISITNSTVYAQGGSNAAAIGTGKGNSPGYNNQGSYESVCGSITISGTSNVVATGGSNGAGIGSGLDGHCGNIDFTNATVTATGGSDGAGIGTGKSSNTSSDPTTSICDEINITGSSHITVQGGSNGAGIGTGNGGDCTSINVASAAQIYLANGGDNGAAIGTGNGGTISSDIDIYGDITRADGGSNSAAIGTGNGGTCGNIIIRNGSEAERIYSGDNTNVTIGPGVSGTCGTVTVNGTQYDPGYTGNSYGSTSSKGKNRKNYLKEKVKIKN